MRIIMKSMKVSLLSSGFLLGSAVPVTSANPATIRICDFSSSGMKKAGSLNF
jgi:hypothetical protein